MIEISPNYEPNRKQLLLHNAPVGWETLTIILYGGSRGGGKSAGMLMDAVQFCLTYPGAKAMILRENISSLKQSFVDKLPTLLPEHVTGKDGKKIKVYEFKSKSDRYPERTLLFPNGSYITFQRVDGLKEAMTKQGWEVHYLGIDEVTKQSKEAVNYLLSTVRSVEVNNPYTGKKLQIPTKVVFGCNPGGPGHKWVKKDYIDPTVIKKHPVTNAPLQTRDHVTYIEDPNDPSTKIKKTIRFIPASWRDNQHLSKSYVAALMAAPEHRRKMDMEGNWDVVAGRMFDLDEETTLVDAKIAYKEIKDSKVVDIYLSVDWGFSASYHAVQWHAVFMDGSVITFRQKYGKKEIFEDFAADVKRKCGNLEITAALLPHDMFRTDTNYRTDSGKHIGETKADVFRYHDLNPVAVESGKGFVEDRYDKIHSAMKLEMERDGKKIKRFRISRALENEEELGLINELAEAVYSETSPGQIDSASLDDAIDAYGHFLVYYAGHIAPIDISDTDFEKKDTRPRLQRKLEEEEKALFGDGDEDNDVIGIAEGYEI